MITIKLFDRDNKLISFVKVKKLSKKHIIKFPEYNSDKMVWASYVKISNKKVYLAQPIPLHNHFGLPMFPQLKMTD